MLYVKANNSGLSPSLKNINFAVCTCLHKVFREPKMASQVEAVLTQYSRCIEVRIILYTVSNPHCYSVAVLSSMQVVLVE